jgi:putative DNA primase/helicase
MSSKVNFVNIPAELKQNTSFCVWKLEKRQGRPTKVPYNPKNGQLARTNDPSTFADFATAMKAYAMGGWDGIGYRVSEGIGAIDIDHCIREDGSLNDVAASIMSFFPDAYFERSPSGTGLRGFFRLSPDFAYDKTAYYINNRKHGLEVYLPGATNRFVTVTGDVYRAGAVTRNDEALQNVLDTFMKRAKPTTGSAIEPCSYLTDEQVIEHAIASESGDKFKALMEGHWEEGYDSQSDADMAFASMLAFWCGNVEEQIDRIFRTSGLMRDKWDRRTGDSTYGQITIRNAVATNGSIYLPVHVTESAEDDFEDLDAEEERANFRPDLNRIMLTLEEMQPHTNPRYQRDEIGIGNAFADYFKPIARFNADRNIWYVYDGAVWQPDENSLAVAELAKYLADQLYTFALQIKDEDTRNRYIKRVQKLQLRKNRKTMVEDAKSVYPIPMSAFDSNKFLFNLENGTLDLSTMIFRPHDPKDFITKISHIDYDPEATCPRWIRFVDEVMEGKAAVARYLQKAVGYSLSGDTSLECLFIMFGPTTRNGKTTTIETILRLMGEYGRSAKPDMLATNYFRGQSNGSSDDVARLAGARFVGISEMEQKLTINASLTKQLTGNGSITARFLYEGYFEFHLQAKIFIDTNHLPNVTDQTLFESGRLKIIPFTRHFSDAEQDKTLKTTLMAPENLSGILNWAIEGYRLYKAEGLPEPDEVKTATEQYKVESDRTAQFMAQCLRHEKGSELKSTAVYNRYKDWCSENGYKYEGSQNFYKRLGLEYLIIKRRPWKQETTGNMNATFLIDNIAWVNGEEPEASLVPDD